LLPDNLLPNDDRRPLASFFVDRALGLDEDNNVLTIEGFRIAGDSIDLGRLAFEQTDGATFELGDTTLTFDNFAGNLSGVVAVLSH
jgi:hypothetical protein